jgi:hypothetical protein
MVGHVLHFLLDVVGRVLQVVRHVFNLFFQVLGHIFDVAARAHQAAPHQPGRAQRTIRQVLSWHEIIIQDIKLKGGDYDRSCSKKIYAYDRQE